MKHKRNQETCRGCDAYSFPHRKFSGGCFGHSLTDCPNKLYLTDPYGTGDFNYRWVKHGCSESSFKRIGEWREAS